MARFDAYGQTPIGQQLAEIVSRPEIIPEYVALSRIGKPAVQAVAEDVRELINGLPTKEERDAANQFVGWSVAQIMRSLGYQLVQERGRVNGAPYRTGAVWSYEPGKVKVGLSVPADIRRKVEVNVKKSAAGTAVADVDARDIAVGAPRTVRTVVAINLPAEDAIAAARRYAERHGFGYVQVLGELDILPTDTIISLR